MGRFKRQAGKTDYLQRNDKLTSDFLTAIIGARGQWEHFFNMQRESSYQPQNTREVKIPFKNKSEVKTLRGKEKQTVI